MKRLESIFTQNMDECIFTGSREVERHHIFYNTSKHKKLSEKYRFIAPLRRDFHPNGVFFHRGIEQECILENLAAESIDEYLKRECQQYYLDNIGTQEEWMEEFYKNYL